MRLPATLFLAFLTAALPAPAAESKDPTDTAGDKQAAVDSPDSKPKDDGKDTEKPAALVPLKSITQGKITLDGKEIPYEAETNTIQLLNDKDEPTASVFYVLYRRTGVENPESRPVLFCFNGGPGSSAVWLHLGGLGPRRVALPGDGSLPAAPPFSLQDNPDCPLDVADLVFVDPVSTGFSRAEKGKDARQFHGFTEDIGYLADFIRRFTDDHDRWASPKHLLGESYGALRVAALADHLQEKYGMYLNGVILLSGLLDFKTLATDGDNDLPYLCFLPAMAANAHFHGCLENSPDVAALVQEARAFAFGDYAQALLAGNRLDKAKREATAARLATLTAIPAATWLDADLRLDPSVFRKLLLKSRGEEIGRFDGRAKAPARDPLSPQASSDPSFDLAWGSFSTTINDYLRRTLKTRPPQNYEVINPGVNPWNYGSDNAVINVGDELASAMRRNPYLKVLVQTGTYDLATPPDAIGHSLTRLDLPLSLLSNVSVQDYPGGHMFYTNQEASRKMRADLIRFLETGGPDN